MARVLIIDDATFMRLSIKTMLESNGFEVAGEAEDGIVGVKKYMECKPDVVTMDITMPNLDGIEALKAIKKFDPNANVIMITAMGQEGKVRDAVLNGAKSFIVKPFEAKQLIATINSVLSK